MRLCQLAISAIPLSKYFINCKGPRKSELYPPLKKAMKSHTLPPLYIHLARRSSRSFIPIRSWRSMYSSTVILDYSYYVTHARVEI
ncbi:hypothetical protein L2E82_33884 [Cichorium intybus]|uniref:Uncharacterized protein n=1 Tax=Cichorium intybus TaxID=13427 RepID=A0ACB9BL90_CICIN|nr:hypothetical protein L2E82_33884 [Cichorium intybus]